MGRPVSSGAAQEAHEGQGGAATVVPSVGDRTTANKSGYVGALQSSISTAAHLSSNRIDSDLRRVYRPRREPVRSSR